MFCLSASFKVPHHQPIPWPFGPFGLHPNLGIYGDAVALTSGCASQNSGLEVGEITPMLKKSTLHGKTWTSGKYLLHILY